MIFVQYVINGLIIGGAYALIGIGLTMVFGIMRVVNFAHGEMYMLGAYFLFTFFTKMGINFYLSMLLAIAAVMGIGGIYEKAILKPLRRRSIETVMLSMIGFSLFIQNIAMLIWTPVPESITSPFPLTAYTLGGLYFLPQRIMVIFAALFLVLLTHLLLKKTKIGKAMRATFQDLEAASLMGIKIDRIYSFTFVIGVGLAASAGTLLGPIFTVHPYIGNLANLKAFAIVIIGGLGSFTGAITAGFLLGVFESLGAGYVSSGYQDAIGFILLIIILIYRPTGLFGKIGQRR
ncbi:MAG: branched-chain amino acid ABC transporter permease [Thermodesulfobacteriota bacterium]|nr:branched-chain amino acid ABC transporter permease [Thermodesulfobacteriota bacterium]